MSTTMSSNRPGGGIKWRWPSVHPEGRKFLLIAGIVTLCFWLLGWEILGWLMLGVTAWVGAFFRDPVRVTPTGSDVVIAPADGLVTQIAEVAPPPEIAPTCAALSRKLPPPTPTPAPLAASIIPKSS